MTLHNIESGIHISTTIQGEQIKGVTAKMQSVMILNKYAYLDLSLAIIYSFSTLDLYFISVYNTMN